MDIIADPIHTIIWLISFIGIIISFLSIYFYREKWRYIIPPLTYLINVFFYNLAFHATLLFNIGNITIEQLDIWTSVVRLHAVFLAILYIVYRAIEERIV